MKQPKYWTPAVLLVVLALAAAACGGGGTGDTTTTSSAQVAEPFRIAVVAPSASNDLAFTQSMVDALTTIQTEMGGTSAIEIAVTDSTFVVEDAAALEADLNLDLGPIDPREGSPPA